MPTFVVTQQWLVTAVTAGIWILVAVAATGVATTTGAGGGGAAAQSARPALVFRVEGSRADPEYGRACGVVRGLEELYGKERYRLRQVNRLLYRCKFARTYCWLVQEPENAGACCFAPIQQWRAEYRESLMRDIMPFAARC